MTDYAQRVVEIFRRPLERQHCVIECSRRSFVDDGTPRTFDNTMLALERATENLDYALSVVRHLESVSTSPELRAAWNAVEPAASAFYSRIPLNEGLWKKLQSYASTVE